MTLLLPEYSLSTLDTVHHTDLLTLCNAQPSQSVDMILCDLPYAVTQATWDVLIPLEPMWAAFKRVVKAGGAIVLTAVQPFTSMLVMSNLKMFRYEWIWNKCSPTGHLNAHRRPMQQHETVLVFSSEIEPYHPQLRAEVSRPFGNTKGSGSSLYGTSGDDRQFGIGFPLSILKYPRPNNLSGGGLHPNQKPEELFEYLIRTYTDTGAVVLDPTCGSGTTAIAARQTGRHFICGDSSAEYVAVARKRLAQPFTLPMLLDVPA